MKPIELREADFKREIAKYSYAQVIKDEFFDYWSEPDRAPSPKMRFEKEKTWHLGRRLARWMKNSKTVVQQTVHPVVKKEVPLTNFDKLDAFITEMRKPGVTIPFESFGNWYDFMKLNHLLRPVSREYCDKLLAWYKGDKEKCRCAIVQVTLSGYITNEITIKDILKIREVAK